MFTILHWIMCYLINVYKVLQMNVVAWLFFINTNSLPRTCLRNYRTFRKIKKLTSFSTVLQTSSSFTWWTTEEAPSFFRSAVEIFLTLTSWKKPAHIIYNYKCFCFPDYSRIDHNEGILWDLDFKMLKYFSIVLTVRLHHLIFFYKVLTMVFKS